MIVIGSRGSALALWQARHVAARLAELGAETRIEIMATSGDKITDAPLAQAGGKALFTKEIEEALLSGAIDLAVHSLKDLATVLPRGLRLAAVPEREEPRDALIGRPFASLAGAKIGTSSLRRSAQLHALGMGVKIEPLRGNVDTRVRKLDQGHYDAIILAAAGLRRLGLERRITELLPEGILCPAAGQGALAIETREDGGVASQVANQLDHPPSRRAVDAERALLEALGGGCQVPIGAYAAGEGASLRLRAVVAAPDGSRVVRDELSGAVPDALGRELGRRMLEQGAREILNQVYSSPGAA